MDRRINNNVNMNTEYKPMIPSQEEDIENALYPEIYKKLSPVVDQLISDMERQYGDIELTDDLLSRMADEVLRRSQMMPYPSESEAMPMINNFGGFNRDRDRNSFGDIVRILLLQRIFGGHRRPRWRRGRR